MEECRIEERGPSMQKSMHGDGVIPIPQGQKPSQSCHHRDIIPGVWGGLGLGSIPPPSDTELLCASPSLSGAGLVALSCPPSASPRIPAAFLGPVAELRLVQALYLLSFSMHTSGALLRHKINKMTVPR